jgi:hypothetical protein
MMTDCIYFDGKTKFNGYGVVYEGAQSKRAHRQAWEQKFGPIPEGFVIDHTCHNEAAVNGECKGGSDCSHRSCVNTDHLRIITQSENILSGLHSVDVKTACPKGHSYPDNIMVRKSGKRECAQCNRERASMYYARRKVA